MPQYVCSGAGLACTFGSSSGSLTVLPTKQIQMENNEAASIMDYAPMVNISDFGNCMSLLNPVVAAATAKNSGVLEPQQCIPFTVSPWMPGSTNVLHTNQPALMDYCLCTCTYMGIITITDAGQTSISSAMAAPDMSAMMAELEAAANEAQENAQKEMEEALKEGDKEK
jgi:hypothetical protein